MSRALPAGLPGHLFEVALAVCARCDPDTQFEFGIEELLGGLAASADLSG